MRGTAAIRGQEHITYIDLPIEFEHLYHLLSMFKFMAEFLRHDHLTLEYAPVHF